MNIAKKLLAAAGVKGAGATIDLVLDRTAYTPGDTITGRFQLKGGIAVQSISSLYAVIKVDVCKNGTWETHNVHPGGIVAEQNITIEPGEEKAIEFTEILPLTVAISDDNSVRYYIKTSLVIDNGKDASDTDVFDVVLPTRYDEIFHDLKVLGYEPKGNFMSFDGQRFRFLNSEHNIEAQLMLYPSHFGGTMVQCHLIKKRRIFLLQFKMRWVPLFIKD